MAGVYARERVSDDGDARPVPRRRGRGGLGRWSGRLALAGLVAVVGVLLVWLPGRRGWFDIIVYHDTLTSWWHTHGHLYDYTRPGTRFGFTYPPFAALCLLPMVWVGTPAAIVINLVITVIASGFVLYVLIDPVARRQGWNRRHTYVMAGCLFLLFGPVRDTFGFGQINLVLVALVYVDLFLLDRGLLDRSRSGWVGVGTGLATAIKLTPAVFILYFLVTGRWRAAVVSAATIVAATAVGAVLAPTATITYFTKAMWDTSRVGSTADNFNQSLLGVVSRLNPQRPNHLLWIGLVVAVLGVWAWRVRAAKAAGDDRAGFALTGLVAGLISPITWVHHLVWIVPALVVLAESSLRPGVSTRRRRGRRWAAIGIYVAFCAAVGWIWAGHRHGLSGFLSGDLDVLLALLMLVWLPIDRRSRRDDHTADQSDPTSEPRPAGHSPDGLTATVR